MGENQKSEVMENIRAIIFDFDFTLADSSKGVEECVSYGFKMLKLPIPSKSEIYKTIGLSLKETFLKLARVQYENKAEAFTQFFIEKADEIMANLTIIFDDVYDVIQILKHHGITLGIVSTKFRYRIESILTRENLLEYFDVIIGAEDVMNHKPNPESLLLALNKLNLSRDNILYIGDSITDAEAAKSAGISFVPVLSGMASKESFRNYQTLVILNNISELLKLLGI
jgi:phosphoglycolate phosphatase